MGPGIRIDTSKAKDVEDLLTPTAS
jgi:hypothetical protein